ncbi:pyridine nucleotide-disulfide oxidoreductase [Sulfolobus sp. A20]|uniref:FAD-dependent oxidoreductase n=1 Tax=Saccharolobus sp. A20 TaxID=1891280 RepID=UPI000845E699|nr:FAD-dependent oxidoreductase [Sulfolobus sp. A20]TRM74557.1 pyridine nucleotide-disulfide oxidoreductase [Sulfolobus sp. A20-N-F8]TRM79114.1 pyridine nucleotide-disulfide oxidoreductase [Sulfolobus sp. B5]TRM82550.1 pyridine nucleotide-disulfide oxidoreductase [Sulfolobus sp. D5]TRM86784.1 pyridine nucleotide-disulfide oxidoreductase [Sulfolobus sp. C3]TRM99613.1 pyridine nucleotide-disulfide oxidoreductase [Sulfolobus sp. E1]TRN01554.1 pyridine nucleotide-disulfide oxidoreductase [Sulfolo
MERVIIVGSGYAGLNAFYETKGNMDKLLISDSDHFIYYTLFLKNMLFNKNINYKTRVKINLLDRVKEIDTERIAVKTNNNEEYQGDYLVLALGCNRSEQISFIQKITHEQRIILGVEDPFDEYLAIQLAFYLKKLDKEIYYSGSYLSWLGDNVSSNLENLMEKYGIKSKEKAEHILPTCKPNQVLGEFLQVKSNLEYKSRVFAIGDMIKGYPKLGELAMRQGIYVGKYLSGKIRNSFNPIFINIIDTGMGEAIHIRSNKPWNGSLVSVKLSRLRAFMKGFLEKYYILRKGKMGFLYYI